MQTTKSSAIEESSLAQPPRLPKRVIEESMILTTSTSISKRMKIGNHSPDSVSTIRARPHYVKFNQTPEQSQRNTMKIHTTNESVIIPTSTLLNVNAREVSDPYTMEEYGPLPSKIKWRFKGLNSGPIQFVVNSGPYMSSFAQVGNKSTMPNSAQENQCLSRDRQNRRVESERVVEWTSKRPIPYIFRNLGKLPERIDFTDSAIPPDVMPEAKSVSARAPKNRPMKATPKVYIAFYGVEPPSPAPSLRDRRKICRNPLSPIKNIQNFWLYPTIEAFEEREMRNPFASTIPPRFAWWSDKDLKTLKTNLEERSVRTKYSASVNGLLNAAIIPPVGYYGNIKKLGNGGGLEMSSDDVTIMKYSEMSIAALHLSHDKKWDENLEQQSKADAGKRNGTMS